ncbi:hypothetical protein P7C70_g9033, partial [Phenoliferia sp. Uapishka_3]
MSSRTTIHSLSTETLVHIISLLHSASSLEPPDVPENYDGRERVFRENDYCVRDLQRASRVCKRWLEVAQPLFWRHLNVWTCKATKLVLDSPLLGNFITREVNFLAGNEDTWCQEEVDWREHWVLLVEGLRGLRKIVLRVEDGLERGTQMDTLWIGHDNLQDLRTLNVNAHFSITHTPPAKFCLHQLELGALVNSPSLIQSIFTSSFSSLTSITLRIDAEPDNTKVTQLLAAMRLVSNQLQTFHLAGTLPGIEEILPQFNYLQSVSLSLKAPQDISLESVSTVIISLPSSVTSLGLSLQETPENMRGYMVEILRKLSIGERGWDGLTVLRCGLCGDGGWSMRGEEEIEEEEIWTDLMMFCEKKGVEIFAE